MRNLTHNKTVPIVQKQILKIAKRFVKSMLCMEPTLLKPKRYKSEKVFRSTSKLLIENFQTWLVLNANTVQL